MSRESNILQVGGVSASGVKDAESRSMTDRYELASYGLVVIVISLLLVHQVRRPRLV